MPRLSSSLIRKASTIDPALPQLLRTCRTLESAQNELRWLREHTRRQLPRNPETSADYVNLLARLCWQRGVLGKPLQYILGSQPFGELDILCQKGVLIPRPETEIYTAHLADLIKDYAPFKRSKNLKILDLCTGTGCIPLLLQSLLVKHFHSIHAVGIDISNRALSLAGSNLAHNVHLGMLDSSVLEMTRFLKADVLDMPAFRPNLDGLYDVVISNPPYISERGFKQDTSASVRRFEPRSALVPPSTATSQGTRPEDLFYPAILACAASVNAKMLLMEVGDIEQALRVAQLATASGVFRVVEVWRDWPHGEPSAIESNHKTGDLMIDAIVRGTGSGRSVFCKKIG